MQGDGGVDLSVVLIVGQLGLGGTERQVELLARGLRSAGARTLVYTLFNEGARVCDLERAGIPVHHLAIPKLRSGLRHPVRLARRLLGLVTQLSADRPQVVHAFLFHAYVLSAFASRMAGVPLFVSGRRSLARYKDGHPMASYAERAANHLTDAFIANCEAVAGDALATEHMPAHKMYVICNAIDIDDVTTARPQLDAERSTPPLRVICVANLIHYKGHEVLLEAMRLLREDDVPVRATLVGDGPSRNALLRRVQDEGLTVDFLGARRDVPSLLAQHDVAVSASFEEGMSNSILEAMAAGLAVVATRVGGTTDLLRGAGVLVPPRDARALADAIAGLARDDGLRFRLGLVAQNRARTLHSPEALAAEHISLYSALLSTKMDLSCVG